MKERWRDALKVRGVCEEAEHFLSQLGNEL
jgi:hypothetical protein